jgi:hypothetical protein
MDNPPCGHLLVVVYRFGPRYITHRVELFSTFSNRQETVWKRAPGKESTDGRLELLELVK